MRDFRSVFLPYCIQKQPDGRYAVLNRNYKPIGFITSEHVVYANYPILVKLRGLKQTTAAKISFKGDSNTKEIFLYNDGCVPTRNKKNMAAYLERLRVLASLSVRDSSDK